MPGEPLGRALKIFLTIGVPSIMMCAFWTTTRKKDLAKGPWLLAIIDITGKWLSTTLKGLLFFSMRPLS